MNTARFRNRWLIFVHLSESAHGGFANVVQYQNLLLLGMSTCLERMDDDIPHHLSMYEFCFTLVCQKKALYPISPDQWWTCDSWL
jgi:hypothetical protein